MVGACGEQELYDAFSGIAGLELDFVDQIKWSDPVAVSGALWGMDIGLYPLLPNEFNEYKCGFKALEYMTMEIPVVSSDVAENRSIIVDGKTGFFASNSDDWKLYLLQLIKRVELREKMGRAGKDIVVNRYSLKLAVEEFMGITG